MANELRYPLAQHHADRLQTSTGMKLSDLTMGGVLEGRIGPGDLRIAPETLEMQAQISEQAGRPQLAENLRRAAELIGVPDERILEIYNCLRPGASSYEELQAIASELETSFNAARNATLVREAAEVYRRRGCLRDAP